MSNQRLQGLAEISLSGDALVKAGEGYVFSLTVAYSGAAAGQAIYLRDALVGSGQGYLVPIVLPAATGTLQLRWHNGKKFETGLFVDFQNAGQVQMEMTYK